MNERRVIFSSRADDQLASIYLYIAAEASAAIADRFTNAIAERFKSLGSFPLRGSRRDDLGPGIRTLAFRRRVTIAYIVEPGEVTILASSMAARISRRWFGKDNKQARPRALAPLHPPAPHLYRGHTPLGRNRMRRRAAHSTH